MQDSGPPSLQKMYFIKQGEEGEELLGLLKNKFKLIDAIRDIITWYRDGRTFTVLVRDNEGAEDEQEEHRFEMHRNGTGETRVTDLIGCVISWLDAGRIYEIVLIPRPPDYHANLN